MNNRTVSIIGAIAVAIALGLVIAFTPESVVFKADVGPQILPLLLTLLFVALLLERALEVFISTWRGPAADSLDLVMSEAQRAASTLKDALDKATDPERATRQKNYDDGLAALSKAEKDKTDFRAGTKRRALWTGLVLGLLVSAVGIRALQSLVEPVSLARLSANQLAAFHLVDVLVTGACLAGGSDALHKIIQLYVNFTEKTSEQVKAKSSGGNA
jgi:hypothetical protein